MMKASDPYYKTVNRLQSILIVLENPGMLFGRDGQEIREMSDIDRNYTIQVVKNAMEYIFEYLEIAFP